eukprot:gene4186-4481_t
MKLIAISQSNNSIFVGIDKKIAQFSLQHDVTSISKVYEIDGMVTTDYSLISINLDEKEEVLYALYSNKYLCSWNIATGESIAKKLLKKKGTALILPTFNKQLNQTVAIISDKAGDIWGYNAPHFTKEVLLAGHTASIVTDLLHCPSLNNTIISADRDEKIRLSSFPDLETVHGYCLNHTSVISSIAYYTVNNRHYLLSTGWDHRVNVWDLQSQQLLESLTLSSVSSMKTNATASEEVEAMQEEVEEQQGEGEDNENNDEEEDGKKYQDTEYGHYPLKIVISPLNGDVAIIYKDSSKIDIFTFQPPTTDAQSSSYLTNIKSIALPALPVDISFLPSSNNLVVLLPKPFTMAVIAGRTADEVTLATFSESLLVSLRELMNESFNQSFVVSLLGYDADTGMRKHELDKPFNKDETINYQAKRGSKRSRKH